MLRKICCTFPFSLMLLVWASRPTTAQPCLKFQGCQGELDG